MKIFLTGATGLLGNNVLRDLLSRGISVRCLTRTPIDQPPASLRDLGPMDNGQGDTDGELELVQGQLTQQDDWRPWIEGCQGVIHSAGSVHIGWRKLETSRKINVVPTERIAKACQTLGVRMIHVSTVDTLAHSLDGTAADEQTRHPLNPPNNYVVSKTEAEKAVMMACQNGLDGVVVHPGFLLGPYDWKPSSGKMLISISKKEIPLAPIGGCSAVDVRNVSQGICNAIEKAKSGENYILGGVNLHYKELFERTAKVIDVRPPKMILLPVIAGIGKGVAQKCTELVQTGKLQQLEDLFEESELGSEEANIVIRGTISPFDKEKKLLTGTRECPDYGIDQRYCMRTHLHMNILEHYMNCLSDLPNEFEVYAEYWQKKNCDLKDSIKGAYSSKQDIFDKNLGLYNLFGNKFVGGDLDFPEYLFWCSGLERQHCSSEIILESGVGIYYSIPKNLLPKHKQIHQSISNILNSFIGDKLNPAQ